MSKNGNLLFFPVVKRTESNVTLVNISLQSNLFKTDTKGTEQVLQRCPYYRGRECRIFGISGTKQTVCNREVSVLKRG